MASSRPVTGKDKRITSRERVHLALGHQVPDRIPLDLGGCAVTGMHASTGHRLRQALALDPPGTPVKVIERYQMLGEIAPDLLDHLGADVVPLFSTRTIFGFRNEGWKPWALFDGTPVLVPASNRLLGAGGGYVFNTIHNVQPGVPVENLLAMYEAVNEQA